MLLSLALCCLIEQPDQLGPLFERAARALQAGDYVSAERDLNAARKLAPGHPAVLANLGVLYTRTERYGGAVQAYGEALHQRPGDARLLFNLGLAHFKQEDYKTALPLFRKVPDLRQARELEAACLLYLDRPAEAIQLLTRLPSQDSGSLYLLALAYLRANEPEKAKPVLDSLFRGAVSPAHGDYLAGKAQQESGHFEEAAALLTRALEREPGLLEARLELAKAKVSLRKNAEAEELFLQVLRQVPSQLEAHYYLGALYTQLDRPDEAMTHLERVVKAKPSFWGGHYYLGRVLAANARYREALPALERAATLNPGEMATWYQIARVARALGQVQKSKEALARYESIRAAKVAEK